MIIVPVPKDVRRFKPKFIGPLTKPQTYSVVTSGLIAALAFSLFSSLPASAVMVPVFIICAPIMACGFIEVRNVPLWIYFRDVFLRNSLAPKRRPYRTENAYEWLGKQALITYEYFDPDFGTVINKKGERVKVKNRTKLTNVKLQEYLDAHPEMAGFE